jgi:hypothetical protein
MFPVYSGGLAVFDRGRIRETTFIHVDNRELPRR